MKFKLPPKPFKFSRPGEAALEANNSAKVKAPRQDEYLTGIDAGGGANALVALGNARPIPPKPTKLPPKPPSSRRTSLPRDHDTLMSVKDFLDDRLVVLPPIMYRAFLEEVIEEAKARLEE